MLNNSYEWCRVNYMIKVVYFLVPFLCSSCSFFVDRDIGRATIYFPNFDSCSDLYIQNSQNEIIKCPDKNHKKPIKIDEKTFSYICLCSDL